MAYDCFEFTVINMKYCFIHNFSAKVNPHKSTTRLEDKTLVYRVGQIGNLSLCTLAQGFHTKLSQVIPQQRYDLPSSNVTNSYKAIRIDGCDDALCSSEYYFS